jgi:ADP-ribosylglycohydrolase
MPRVDPDKAAGALLGLALAGDSEATEMAMWLAWSLIEAGGYDPARLSYSEGPAVRRTTPIGIAFAGRDEALRDATLADAALTDSEPLAGKVALLHNQVVAWAVTGGERLAREQLVEPEWLDDRIEDVGIPATAGVRHHAVALSKSEPGSPLASLAIGLAAFFNAGSFEEGLGWAAGPGGAVTGALLGARFGADELPRQAGQAEIEAVGRTLAAMAG